MGLKSGGENIELVDGSSGVEFSVAVQMKLSLGWKSQNINLPSSRWRISSMLISLEDSEEAKEDNSDREDMVGWYSDCGLIQSTAL